MKRLVTFILVIMVIGSCKKLSNCYECTFGLVNGHKPNSQTYCGKNPEQHKFQDSEGNLLNVIECKHE